MPTWAELAPRHRLDVTPGLPLYPPNVPAYANVGTTTNNWMRPNDDEKMDESPRTTTPGESHGVPEVRHHFGMRRLHPRCAEAAFPPGNQAQRIQLRGRYFRRLARRALSFHATIPIGRAQPPPGRIRPALRAARLHGSGSLRHLLDAAQ